VPEADVLPTGQSCATPAARPDILRSPGLPVAEDVVQRPVPLWERLYNNGGLRKIVVLVLLAGLWQGYAVYLGNGLLFPTFTDTVTALASDFADGSLPAHIWVSLQVLLVGYAAGVALAAILTGLAIATRLGTDVLEILTAMFNPLPAIALLPLAMIWFGLGETSLVFVIVQSVVWATALNTYSGFRAVSPTLRMIGRNYGLGQLGYITKILVPAAFPSILAGLKISWAFAWRTLIASELVFGVSAGSGGLGWFIYEAKNSLDIPAVFAGLLTIICIGLLVENLIFRIVEYRTIRRWGQHT
jgi:NitT/TauT family transport system permease protein